MLSWQRQSSLELLREQSGAGRARSTRYGCEPAPIVETAGIPFDPKASASCRESGRIFVVSRAASQNDASALQLCQLDRPESQGSELVKATRGRAPPERSPHVRARFRRQGVWTRASGPRHLR